MENEALISTSQINDEFTLMSLFFMADLVVKLVILILFAAKYGEPVSSGFQWRPDILVKVDGDKLKSLINLINELDSDEDVQQIFSNFEASDEELSRIA